MFKLSLDDRLLAWSSLRKQLENSGSPFEDLMEFWNKAQLVGYNTLIDPYCQANWPTPWEIIDNNVYDDFTKAIMMGYTLLLTERFKNNYIEVKTLIDRTHGKLYNIVCINEICILNFKDDEVVDQGQIPGTCCVENLTIIKSPM